MSPSGEDLSQFRGVLTFEGDVEAIHVLAPAEAVAEAVAALSEGAVTHADVVGKEIPLTHQGFAVVQFEGQEWSTVISADPSHQLALQPDDAEEISRALKTRCLDIRVREEEDLIAYGLFDNGQTIEEYVSAGSGLDDEFADAGEFEEALREDLGLSEAAMVAWREEYWGGATAEEYFEAHQSGIWFASERREVKEESLDDASTFVDAMFAEEGVADLGLNFETLIGRDDWSAGDVARIEPLESPAFRRVEWVSLPDAAPREEDLSGLEED
jgi:hypothetical protein